MGEFLPIAQSNNIAVMRAGVFNSGILATGAIPHAKLAYADATPDILDKVRRLEALCHAHSVTIRQAAIQLAGAHPAVASVVLGAVKPDEVIDNVRDAEAPVPAAPWADLEAAALFDPAAPTRSDCCRRTVEAFDRMTNLRGMRPGVDDSLAAH